MKARARAGLREPARLHGSSDSARSGRSSCGWTGSSRATEAYDDEWFAAQLERLVVATGDSVDEMQRGFGSFAAQTTFAGLYPRTTRRARTRSRSCSGSRSGSTSWCARRSRARPRRSCTCSRSARSASSSRTRRSGGSCALLEGLVRGTAEHYGEDGRGRGDPVHAPRRPRLRFHRTCRTKPGRALRRREASAGGAHVAGSGRARPRHLRGNP